MRAAVHHRYGPPEVLQLCDTPMPAVADNQVLIRIHASSVSSGDCHMRQADPVVVRLFNGLWRPKRRILGSEFAGTIEQVGRAVTDFCCGDAVFGATGLGLGANADYLCLADDAPIALKPANISFEQAAAIPFGAVTAHYFLRQLIQLQPGQRLLVYGAAGAVGINAVQLGKLLGAHVTAVCREKNHQTALRLGADEVIDYQQQDYSHSDQRWDVIIDCVGKTGFTPARRVLTGDGCFLVPAAGLKTAVQLLANTLARTLRFTRQRIAMGIAIESQADIVWLAQQIENQQLKAVIDRQYPLEDIVAAHQYVQQGHKAGSVVLSHD